MVKASKYSILIICEGENTEPLFFDSIRDAIIEGVYDIGDVKIKIKPEPEEDDEEVVQSEHKAVRNKRQTRKAFIGAEPVQEKKPLPLKWVLEGQKELEEGTYNEVWTVFDHDNHPARTEAFAIADKNINGSQVHIAFSSHCFEYYLLLHFERIYKRFVTSECRDKNNEKAANRKKPIYCCSERIHVDDCQGEKCIGGYARLKKYWACSKNESSTYNLIKDKIEIGFENSAWLRYVSDLNENEKQICDRDPYTNTDYLVKRLTGNDHRYWSWLALDEDYIFDEISIKICNDKKIVLQNRKSQVLLIPSNSFSKVSSDSTRISFGSRLIFIPNQVEIIDFSSLVVIDEDSWFMFVINNYSLMFKF